MQATSTSTSDVTVLQATSTSTSDVTVLREQVKSHKNRTVALTILMLVQFLFLLLFAVLYPLYGIEDVADCSVVEGHQSPLAPQAGDSTEWSSYKSTFGRTYSDPDDEQAAFARWLLIDTRIRQHNADATNSYQLSHNHLSDLTRVPKGHVSMGSMNGWSPIVVPKLSTASGSGRLLTTATTLGHRRSLTTASALRTARPKARLLSELAASVDWVAAGKVTEVKNQGQCDSCWTFSSTGAIEAAYAIENDADPFDLSPQQLVACNSGATTFDNSGTCSVGGNVADAFLYAGAASSSTITVGMWNPTYFSMTIAEVGWTSQLPTPVPIRSYADYSYTGGCVNGCTSTATGCSDSPSCQAPIAGTQTCLLSSMPTANTTVSISGFSWVETEADLLAAVAQQPVSVAIYAGTDVQAYTSGVLDVTDCSYTADHAVLLVGYGNDPTSGLDYWKIKNSWGSDWGEDGYFRMVRGKNMCALGNQSLSGLMAYPTGATMSGSVSLPEPSPPPSPAPPASSASPSAWSNPNDGACATGSTDINQPITVANEVLTIGPPATSPCSPSCTGGTACPTGGTGTYPYCYYTSSIGDWCALICGINSWTCPAGMACSAATGSQGTCIYS